MHARANLRKWGGDLEIFSTWGKGTEVCLKFCPVAANAD